MIPTTILRGQLYYANLEPSFGSEQGGIRPVLIIQNDVGNMYSPTVIIAALTGRLSTKHSHVPTHLTVSRSVGLKTDSIVLLEQLRTIDKMRLRSYIGRLSNQDMDAIDDKLMISLALPVKVFI